MILMLIFQCKPCDYNITSHTPIRPIQASFYHLFGLNSIMETNVFIRANVNLIHKLGKDHVIAFQDLAAPK